MKKIATGSRCALLCGAMMAFVLAGCLTTGSRFSPDVQESFQENDMRRMETANLKLYYPAHRQAETRHIATRLEDCYDKLQGMTLSPTDWGSVPIYLPEVEFNNAYAFFAPGQDPHMVIPTFFTANIFGELGYTPSVSAVGCHEMVHYIHLIQVHGFYRAINEFFGPTINPQSGFDSWFFEGLATYYESKLVDGVGRYSSPVWENYFAAGIVDTHLDGGRMSSWDRQVSFGGHYLVGSHFVAYLVETYGEQPLWHLVHRQGASILFPFGVSLRFRRAFGKPLGTLISEFEAEMRRRYPARIRPADQERQKWVGRNGMLESGPHGRWALFSSDVDAIAAIEIFDSQDRRLHRREIPDVLPGRQIVGARALEAMRFTPDGESLYFLVNHLGSSQPRTSLMHLDIESGKVRTIREDLVGLGGDLTPEADAFILAAADGNRVRFQRIELESGEVDDDEELFILPAGAYVGWVRVSPDGTRLAATLMEDDLWSVAIFELEDGELIGKWSTGESHLPAFDPYWLDDQRILFVASQRRRIQIMEGHLDDGSVISRSNVPYMAFNAGPDGDGGIRFLNREGWGWALDRISDTGGTPTEAVSFDTAADGADVGGYQELDQLTAVLDDRPYSMLDGLFIPRLRVPGIGIDGLADDVFVSLGLTGYDELGFHNWLINAQWNFGDEQLSGALTYINTQLAPWFLTFRASDISMTIFDTIEDMREEDFVARGQRERLLSVEAVRPVYGMPMWLEFRALDYFLEGVDDAPQIQHRFVGSEAGAEYLASRSTPYGGAQWLFGLSGQAGGYPSQFGSDFTLGHLRSQIQLASPLPFSSRHRLQFTGRARAVLGVPDQVPLMRIGGFGAFAPAFISRNASEESMARELVPPRFLFSETLRGYEDLGLLTNEIAIGDLNYRYPIVIDRGAASVLGGLPSVFVRGFNFEAFASGAVQREGNIHAAVGASADFSMVLWTAPVRFRYQIAQRLFDDEALVHTISTGLGF